MPKISASNSMTTLGDEPERIAELLGRNLRPLRHARRVQHQERRPVVLALLLQEIDHVLGVPQVREIGHGRDHHVVGGHQDLLGPGRPDVRQVDRDERHVLAHHIEHELDKSRARCRSCGRARREPQTGSDDPCTWRAGGRAAPRRGDRASASASAMPWTGSWLKSRPAVPNGRSRSAMTTLLDSRREITQAVLWQTVEEPTPPLAPTKAMTWPTGSVSGLL